MVSKDSLALYSKSLGVDDGTLHFSARQQDCLATASKSGAALSGTLLGWLLWVVPLRCCADGECAPLQVGVNASAEVILDRLIRSDTASAFNITTQDVNVTGTPKHP